MTRSDFSSISNENPHSSFGKVSEATSETAKSQTFSQKITNVVRQKFFDIVMKEQYYSPCDKSYVKALKSNLKEQKKMVELQKDNHKSSSESNTL